MSVELEQYLTSLGIEEGSSQIYAEYLASGCSVFTLFDLQDKQPSVAQLYDVGITLLQDRLLIANAYADATPQTVESYSEPRPRSPSKPEATAHSKSTRRSLTKKFSNNAFHAKDLDKKDTEDKGDDSSEESKDSRRSSKKNSSRAISFHMFTIASDPVPSRKDRIELSPKPKSDDKPEHFSTKMRSHRGSEKLKAPPNKGKKPANKIEAVQLGQKKRRNSFDATYLPNSTPVYSATYSKFEQVEVTKLKEEGVIFSNETDVLGATIKQIISFFLRISQDKSKMSAFVVAYRHFFTLNEFMGAVDEVYSSSLNDENMRECVISTRVANLLKVLFETEFKSFPEYTEAQNLETYQLFDEFVKKILNTNFSIGTHLSLQLDKSLNFPQSPNRKEVPVQPLPESIADAERDVLLLLHETAVSAYAFDFLSADPSQLARQLFCIDLRLMQAILPADLYNVKWLEEGRSRPIEAAVRLTNNLTYFLISQVVKLSLAKDRVQAVTHIINFASELLAVQNFNSLLSVYLFFKNRSITQLEKCTLSRLDRRAKERLTDILITMDPLNNFFNYRAYFETLLPPKICCLEVALKDLLFESESSPNRITSEALTHLLTNEQRQKRQSNPWDAHPPKQHLAVEETNNQNNSSSSGVGSSSPLHSPHALVLSDPTDSHSPSTPPSTMRGSTKSVSFVSNTNSNGDVANAEPLIYNIGKLIKMGLLIDQITLRHVQHDIERDEPMQRALHSLLCSEKVNYDPDELHAQSSALLIAITKTNSSNALQLEKDTLNNHNGGHATGSPTGNTSRNTSPVNSSRNLIVNSRSPPNSNHTSPRSDSPPHRSSDGGSKERKNRESVSFAQEPTELNSSHSDHLTQRIASKVTRSPIKRVPIGSSSAPVRPDPDASDANSNSSDGLSSRKSNPQISARPRTFSASALLGANNSLFG